MYSAHIIDRNLLVYSYPTSFCDFHYILIFENHPTPKHSVDANGLDVCFEMGKKCYRMCTLYILHISEIDTN